MMFRLRALLVDPYRRTVEPVEGQLSLKQVHETIGCTCITSFTWEGCFCLCNDEGLFHPIPRTYFSGFQEVAGRVLIYGPPRGGHETPCTKAVDRIRPLLTFEGDVSHLPG